MLPDTSPEQAEHERMKDLMKENHDLLVENNNLLKAINKRLWWGFWTQVVWYVFLFGLPFALYYYVLNPYFSALGSSFQTFSDGMQEIPGWKQLNNAISDTESTEE